MAALPEVFSTRSGVPSVRSDADARLAAVVLPLRRTDAQGRRLVDETSGDRLGPIHGLLIGLGSGAVLWLALGLLLWEAV